MSVKPNQRVAADRFQSEKLRAYLERLLICLDILDTLSMTEDHHITAAHKEALAIWKEPVQ